MEIKGFTPAVDELTDKYGGTISLIYGAMWRFAQMSPLGLCSASQAKIGERAGVERETVNRNIPKMEGSLIERAGTGPGGTIAYKCLVDIRSAFTMAVTSNHNESDVKSQPPVTTNHTKKDIKKGNKSRAAEAIRRGLKLASKIQADFQEHLGLTPNWNTKTNQEHYQFFREGYDSGQTVEGFADWWKEDWKGKDGSLPSSLNQVRTLWAQAFMKEKENQHKYRKGR